MRILLALMLLTMPSCAFAYVAHGESITAKWDGRKYQIKRYETYVEAVNEASKYGCQVFTDYDTDGGVVICGPEIKTAVQITGAMEQD